MPQGSYSLGKNTFSCSLVHVMKAYEITVLPRWGNSCFISSSPGDGISMEFWDLSKSCGHGQRCGPVGLQG